MSIKSKNLNWECSAITFTLLCLELVVTNAIPLKHYGPCQVDNTDELGYCLPRDECWESPNDSYLIRNKCPSLLISDLICCRNKSQRSTAPSTEISSRLSTEIVRLPGPEVCGTELSYRIIAGVETSLSEFPWMVLLRYTNDDIEFTHQCGGSLIHERWVLTAAHCVPTSGSNRLVQARLGEWNTSSAPDCQQFLNDRVCAPLHRDVRIDRIIVHERYTQSSIMYPNDIALLRLANAVSFNEYIMPICLPAANTAAEHGYTSYVMDIAGWGNTETIRFGGSPLKRKTALRIISQSSCKRIFPSVSAGQLCAGGSTPASSCHGDSGGPLMNFDKNGIGTQSYYLTGIVSLGTNSCSNRGLPVIFTKVEYYVNWIITTINANSQ